MAQEDLQEIPWALISAWLAQQATPEQAEDLQAWRQARPENEARYREAERLWLLSGQVGPGTASFDSQADWPLLAQKAGIQAPVRSLWQRPMLRWAAVIVLLATVGIALRWLSRPGTPQWESALAGTENRSLYLPDGTEVILRPGSELRYPAAFADTARRVELVGEAWFDVIRDTLRPFQIQGPSLGVRVLGTSFAVRDLAGDSTAQVDLATGRVQVDAASRLILEPGQSARRTGKLLAPIPQSPYFLAWRRGELRFDDTPLEAVLPALSRYFEIPFRASDQWDATNARLTATFSDEPLADVVAVLEITLGVKIEATNQQILLRDAAEE